MNKKIFSRLLIGSAIVLPLSVVALSWSMDQKASEEKINQELKYVGNEFTLNKSNNLETNTNSENPSNPRKTIDQLTDSVQFDYPGKSLVVVEDAQESKFESTGYDKELYEVLIDSVFRNHNDHSIDVLFQLKNKLSDEVSQLTHRTIFGFKDWGNYFGYLNDSAKKVEWDYPNKQNIFASKSNTFNFVSSNFDANKHEAVIHQVSFNDDEGSVTVSFVLKDKRTNETSEVVSKKITGFKTKMVESENLDDIARKVTFDYFNKENVVASDAESGIVESSGYDKSEIDVLISDFTTNAAEGSATVTYFLKHKKTKAISDGYRKQIFGFAKPKNT